MTTFRASDDYGPGQTGHYPTQKNASLPPTDGSTGCGFPYCVYYVGTTSILAWALQLGPSKGAKTRALDSSGKEFGAEGPSFCRLVLRDPLVQIVSNLPTCL